MDTKIFEQPQTKMFDVENQFDLGNVNLVTINPGYLVPVYSQYCQPGASVDYGTDVYGRLMPMINPLFSKYKFYIYNFFVPTRVVFPHFERWRSGLKVSSLDGTSYSPVFPRIYLAFIAIASSYQMLSDALLGTGANIIQTLNYVGIWTNSLPDYLNLPCTNEVSFDRNPQIISGSAIQLIDTPLVNTDSNPYNYFTLNIADNETALSYFQHNPKQPLENVSQGDRLVFIDKFISYTLIWYDYFRDWRLEDYKFTPYDFIHECTTEKEGNYSSYFENDGPALFCEQHPQLNWFALRRRTFTSDMFISAFPKPQLGDAMNIPQIKDFKLTVDNPSLAGDVLTVQNGIVSGANTALPIPFNFTSNNIPTIDQLHLAEQLQKYFQILMVHGIENSDLDKIFYGVYSTKPYDKPVFIDGDTFDFNFDEVLQTSQTTDDSPLGDFAGRGSVFGQLKSNKVFTTDEFGYFFTLVCAVPKQAYFQGFPREFTRRWDIYELPNPLFAHLGFDNIQEEELFFTVTDNSSSADSVYILNKRDFGYMTRYIDSRVHNDEIHGSFRSSLTNWHTARIFSEAPNLDYTFTNVQHWDFARVFAVQQFTSPNILLMIRNKFNVKQNLPYYCNPF